MRVFGWQTLMRNESKVGFGPLGRNPALGWEALSTDRSLAEDLSNSISVGTRKMVIYA